MTTDPTAPATYPARPAMMRSARAAAIYAANHPAAIAAHADYLAGMTWTKLEKKHGLSDTALRDHWRKENLPYQTGRRKVER